MKSTLVKIGMFTMLAFATTVSLNSCGNESEKEGTEQTEGGKCEEGKCEGDKKCEEGKCESGKCEGDQKSEEGMKCEEGKCETGK